MKIQNFSKSFVIVGWGAMLVALSVFGISQTLGSTSKVASSNEVAPVQFLELASTNKKGAVPVTELQCLAKNIYYEAGGESFLGKLAVGHVVLNRLSKSDYPNTVCGVVNERSKDASVCQFSWVCKSNIPKIDSGSLAWKTSYDISVQLLTSINTLKDVTEGATNFHAVYVKPDWSATKKKVVTIDQHVFYK